MMLEPTVFYVELVISVQNMQREM